MFAKGGEKTLDKNNETKLQETEKQKTSAIPPKLELALHLAEEPQKIKQEQVAKYMNSVPEHELEKLKDVANMLGIKKEKMKKKEYSDTINLNEETLNEIARKFTTKKN